VCAMLTIIVAVSHARWEAAYDVRIDMGNPKTLARVVYKANITQTTGEVICRLLFNTLV